MLAHVSRPGRRLEPLRPPALSLDLEPLVEAIVARLRPLLDQGETRPAKRAFRTVEVAEMLSLSPREVERLVASGELPSVRIGRIRLITSSAIDAFLAARSAA